MSTPFEVGLSPAPVVTSDKDGPFTNEVSNGADSPVSKNLRSHESTSTGSSRRTLAVSDLANLPPKPMQETIACNPKTDANANKPTDTGKESGWHFSSRRRNLTVA